MKTFGRGRILGASSHGWGGGQETQGLRGWVVRWLMVWRWMGQVTQGLGVRSGGSWSEGGGRSRAGSGGS